ncbi:hypothetical protein GFS24_12860 [Chitinophaga sp. SYP-B3965]|uniref:hypothetical protein n=1 Tax=Chitinophaga sp. SYP-B3965 TaxID=2663120 RepID=UPI001299D35D|nr:hypothetical protein [Chitinophaga sp. SYP-B3965]MRG46011.1 hypothetical protein [Chitinophaga sp. SYP-B3965]
MQSKFILPAAVLMLSLYACTKQQDDSKKVIDYATYGYVSTWKEIESRTGTTNWVEISNGSTFSIFSNSIDLAAHPIRGEYRYIGVNPGISIDSAGFIQQTNDSLYFVARGRTDTTILQYKNYGDSVLVINDQIKYRKVR